MPKLKKIILKFALTFSMLFLISLNLICSYALEVSSEAVLDGGFDILPDGNGNFFVLSYDQNNTKSTLAYIDNTGDTPSIKQFKFFINGSPTDSLDYKYTTANYYNNLIYLTHIKNTDTIIEQYQIALSRNLCVSNTSQQLKATKIEALQQITLGNNGNLFISKSSNENSIAVYDASGGQIASISSQSGQTFHTVATDISKKYLYALDNSNNMLRYSVNSDTYKLETPSSEIKTSSFKFLTDNIFVISDGYICTLNGTDFKLDSKSQIAAELKNYPTCVTGGFDESSILAKTDDKIISRIRCSDGAVTGKIELNENILALSTSGEKIIAVTEGENVKNINLISQSDIVEISPPEPETPGESGGNQGGDGDNKGEAEGGNEGNENTGETGDSNPGSETGGSESDKDNPEKNPSDETDDASITSDIHHIDLENHIISEIPAGTTFAEFKNNLIFNGYSLVFKDTNGNVKTGNSTKIGTGYTVTFVKDGAEKESFKLIVQGDVTGTGTLTSRDISAFVNYLLGKASLDGLYLQAADLNGDGEPDVIDLFAMYKSLQK